MKVVVVGAGAIGLSCAYFAAKSGADVTVLDRVRPGAGASTRNAGWVVPSMSGPVPSPSALAKGIGWALRSDSPLHVRPSFDPKFIGFMARMVRNCSEPRFLAGLRATALLNAGTRGAFDDLERDGLTFEHHHTGVLQAFLHERDVHSHVQELALLEEFGNPPARVLNAAEVTALEPGLSSNVEGGILSDSERFLDPAGFVDALHQRCLQLGVRFENGVTVTGVQANGDRAVSVLAGRTWRADKFVLAAGVWTRQIARSAGVRLPLQAGKGYGFDFTPPPIDMKRAIYLGDRKVAVTPLNKGVRLSGTMEFAGLDQSISTTRANSLVAAAAEYFTDWPTDRTPEPWTGMRPMTPDGLPLLGVLPHMTNVAIATGHAMLGITLAPVTGRLVCEALMDGAGAPELEPFSPMRFQVFGRSKT